jgi:hypothetical protein
VAPDSDLADAALGSAKFDRNSTGRLHFAILIASPSSDQVSAMWSHAFTVTTGLKESIPHRGASRDFDAMVNEPSETSMVPSIRRREQECHQPTEKSDTTSWLNH